MNGRQNYCYTLAKITACVIFGFSYLFTDRALTVASPFVLLSCRFAFASVLLFICSIPYRKKHHRHQKKPFWPMLFLGVFEPTLYLLLESYAILNTSTAFSSVMLSLTPLLSVFLASIILREKPTSRQYLGVIVSVLGVVLVSWENVSSGVVEPIYLLVLFGAMLCSAIFAVLSRKYAATYSAFDRTLGMFFTATIVFVALALFENRHNMRVFLYAINAPEFIVSILYLGGLSSVVAFFLVNYSNNRLPVVVTSAMGTVTPVVSLLVGVFLLKEPFGLRSLIGVFFILIGTVSVQKAEKRKVEAGQHITRD